MTRHGNQRDELAIEAERRRRQIVLEADRREQALRAGRDESRDATDVGVIKRGVAIVGVLGLAGIAFLFASTSERTPVVLDHVIEGSVVPAGGGEPVEFRAGVMTDCREDDDSAVVSGRILLVTTTEVNGVAETRADYEKTTFNPYDGSCEEAVAAVYADHPGVQGMVGSVTESALVQSSLDDQNYRNDTAAFLEQINQAVTDGVPVVQG